jgi:hypothetical protein
VLSSKTVAWSVDYLVRECFSLTFVPEHQCYC